jgi:DNA (cytosine-5)-methyltransferase 1
MQFNIADLFAGAGGLSYGFMKHGGFRILFANEIDEDAAQTYSYNHPSVPMYRCDVAKLGRERIEADIGPVVLNVIVGGPPCQAYSTAGQRKKGDKRGELFGQYARMLEELNPTMFLYENVVGLLSMEQGKLLERIQNQFGKLGYVVDFRTLNTAAYGVPQTRERVIIVGTKRPIRFTWPALTHAEHPLTIADAISDLPEHPMACYASEPQNEFQKSMRVEGSPLLYHEPCVYGEKLTRIIEALPEGGTVKDLPENLRPTSGFGNSYARLWWNRPSTTVTSNLGTPSSARCIHPHANRALTTREGARLQTFPDSYLFFGRRGSKNLQIGNAVPPILAKELAKSVFDHLSAKVQ